jgi:hydroxymethylbilane synthase
VMVLLTVRIGARSSTLSRAQASIVSSLLKDRSEDKLNLEFVPVKTLGDRLVASKKDPGSGGAKGAFTGDLEELLLKGKIDVAIHSMKDLPSQGKQGLEIGATPARTDPRDVLVTRRGETITTLPKDAKIGTSSLRRRAQLLRLRRDLKVIELHGNIDTRLRKVAENAEGLDGLVLASAGLHRIGEAARISQTFSIDEMVPAVGQGIIAVQIRREDPEIEHLISKIDDKTTRLESRCERAFAQRLGADCDVPVGGCARVSGEGIEMFGMLANDDGSGLRRKSATGRKSEARLLGKRLAEELIAEAGGMAS